MRALILSTLDAALNALPPGPLRVGFSGGMDSTVLMHALASLSAARARDITAIHVDHGLHPHSAQWASHCEQAARSLSIPCIVATTTVHRDGTGLEAAARAARYAVFATHLLDNSFLALAHHRDDQSETSLLKLLRGAGPEGLGGMRPLRVFANGWLWRPLLELPRDALYRYALDHGLNWIEDPSNADRSFARNRLRAEILPALRIHWPQLDESLAHAARHARAAADFIAIEAHKALARLQGLDPSTLRWRDWLALPDALRDPVLRAWLRGLRLPEPTHVHVAELERQLRDADEERLPCVSHAGAEWRRYRDLLYARRAQPDPHKHWQTPWTTPSLDLPCGCGRLVMLNEHGETAPPEPLRVTFRRGGERLRPPGSPHTRELRDLFQNAGIPPWLRPRLPLIHLGDTLLAVADLWRSEEGDAWLREHALQLRFEPGV